MVLSDIYDIRKPHSSKLESLGKVTRHFILLGRRNIPIHYSVGRFFEENKVKEETKKEMEAMSYVILKL